MMRHTMLSLAFFAAAGPACAAPSAADRAQALVRRQRAPEAAALLRERLRERPDDIAARRLLIRALALAGDALAARAEVAELALRLPPNDPVAYIELGHALELSHLYDDALAAYDQAADIAPASPDGPREGGMRCARWGQVAAAQARLEEAVRRGARDAVTWHALGLVRMHAGDLAGAEDAYRAGTVSESKGAENWLGLATVAIVRGDPEKALDAYDQVLAREPRFAPAELGRAWALGKLGRAADASRALDRAEALGAPAANVARQRAALIAPARGAER